MATNSWRKEIWHSGLQQHKVITGATPDEVERKAFIQQQKWAEQWDTQQRKRAAISEKEFNIHQAEAKTKEAENIQEILSSILINTYYSYTAFDLDSLKDYSEYSVPAPQLRIINTMPQAPKRTDEVFNPKPTFLQRISPKKKEEFDAENEKSFHDAYRSWETECSAIQEQNRIITNKYHKDYELWEKAKEEYYSKQRGMNDSLDNLGTFLEKGEKEAVEIYTKIYINNTFNNLFESSIDTEYIEDSRMLIVDYLLPTIENLPNLKAVNYIKSKQEFKEVYFSDAEMKRKYDNVIYQITLALLFLIYEDNKLRNVVDLVTFNGKVKTINKSTGRPIEPYILSITAKKEDVESLNIPAVDPKEWFKSARGVSAAHLANVTPVSPIVQMTKEDKRFIDGYTVVDQIDDSMNLAAMDWQDFENLIRELFEEEFASNGGEVKITQASRDGGVDAVIFDPDPIRGGKIVVQAKRYTNVVGVSAVRDLYGTVMNEGDMKGILVTTSNYGNDAYDFVKDKPLTLLNGSNLLYLLEKHGHKARIDIEEAKRLRQ